MKTFTYVAAIALLTAGTAFAQAQSGTTGANGSANGSTINNSTPTPAAKGPAEGAPHTSTGMSSDTMMNHSSSSMSGTMDKSNSSSSMGSSSMDQSSNMDHSMSNASKARTHHAARNDSRINAREDRETMQLNRQQLAGNTSTAPGSMGYSGYSNRMSTSGAGNPFNNGSPQQAQGGGSNCTPDNPSCGTARENPAINSSPQHRTYGTQQR